MKNNTRNKADYGQLRRKLFWQTALMLIVSFLCIWGSYTLFFHGRLANAIVFFIQKTLRLDYDSALMVYQQTFRNHMEMIFMVVIVIFFLILFIFFLNYYTKYFDEINRGIDELIKENGEEITLLPELRVTEKKLNTVRHTLEKREKDAKFAEQRKNDLVVYLAHDLKTPLTSVIGYLTLLRDEGQISEELREKYLTISLDKAERLEDLINEFFEITRFNLTNITLEYSRVNLTLMLQQLLYEFKPMFVEKNLQCTLNAPANYMIKCDVDKMQRVFDNLLRNAVNYSFDDSIIEINVTPSEESLKIEFKNHGNTIPEEKLGRIFEQFYRLDSSRATRRGGAGLGLAIAKEIIELHNGTITAQSQDELIMFEVVLPIL